MSRGLPLDQYAFPTMGIPDYRAVGPAVEPSVIYSIARQESVFNPRTLVRLIAQYTMEKCGSFGAQRQSYA